jgi:hypothetical protein
MLISFEWGIFFFQYYLLFQLETFGFGLLKNLNFYQQTSFTELLNQDCILLYLSETALYLTIAFAICLLYSLCCVD